MEAPIFIGELELTEPITGVTLPVRERGQAYTGARLLVRVQHAPVGYVFLPPASLDADAISSQVWREMASKINMLRARAGLRAIDAIPTLGIPVEEELQFDTEGSPFVTVVLCTRDRPESVTATLRTLVAMHYGLFEIVVVDNAPSSDETRDAVLEEFGNDPRVRYVREPRPGLSCARNRGISEANGEYIAFTDDDVLVDPWWLDGIMRGFLATTDVACVTGLVTTAEIESAAQLYFDLRSGWATVRGPRTFDLDENRDDSPLYPYSPGVFGTGANFAATRKCLDELDGFDEALGAGTPSGGGEDIEFFMRVILSGRSLAYEPSAIVSHYHRSSLSDLERQMTTYGSGFTASIMAVLMKSQQARREIPSKVARGVMRLFTLGERTSNNTSLPSGLMAREMRGMLTGPWLYVKRWREIRIK